MLIQRLCKSISICVATSFLKKLKGWWDSAFPSSQCVLGFGHLNHSSLLCLIQITVIKCYCPSDTSDLQAALVSSLFPDVSQGANNLPKPCMVSDLLGPQTWLPSGKACHLLGARKLPFCCSACPLACPPRNPDGSHPEGVPESLKACLFCQAWARLDGACSLNVQSWLEVLSNCSSF